MVPEEPHQYGEHGVKLASAAQREVHPTTDRWYSGSWRDDHFRSRSVGRQ